MNQAEYISEMESTLDELADYVERKTWAHTQQHWCGFCALGAMWARSHCHRCGVRVPFPNDAQLCMPCDSDLIADAISEGHL